MQENKEKITENEARRRERAAFVAGATNFYENPRVPSSIPYCAIMDDVRSLADERYPQIPRPVTRQRVLIGPTGVRYCLDTNTTRLMVAESRPLGPSEFATKALCDIPASILKLYLDLLENPTETVEVEDD